MIKVTGESGDTLTKRKMAERYYPLEKHLRELPLKQNKVTLTFGRIQEILKDELPPPAYEERAWWGNQKPGLKVELVPWMDAGWLVETVDFDEKWVRFVRQ